VRAATAAGGWGRALPAVTAAGAVGCLVLGLGVLALVRRADLVLRAAAILPRRWRVAIERKTLAVAAWRAATAPFFRRPERIALCCLFTLGHWLAEAFETYAVARLLGLPIGPGAALGFESLMALGRSLAFFLPGGIGLQDSGQVLLAHLSGVSNAALVGAAFVMVKRSKELLWTATAAVLTWSLARASAPVEPGRPAQSSPAPMRAQA
jgi:hypothetical protein